VNISGYFLVTSWKATDPQLPLGGTYDVNAALMAAYDTACVANRTLFCQQYVMAQVEQAVAGGTDAATAEGNIRAALTHSGSLPFNYPTPNPRPAGQ
jgi:hypothetical protein